MQPFGFLLKGEHSSQFAEELSFKTRASRSATAFCLIALRQLSGRNRFSSRLPQFKRPAENGEFPSLNSFSSKTDLFRLLFCAGESFSSDCTTVWNSPHEKTAERGSPFLPETYISSSGFSFPLPPEDTQFSVSSFFMRSKSSGKWKCLIL